MNNWSAEAWRKVLDSSPEGVVVCDAVAVDCPVIYANRAFAARTAASACARRWSAARPRAC
jgi:PAS domain-containing protein